MKTRVYITVDVECAEERGQNQPLQGYDLRVFGRFENQKDALGIELLMRELEACGQRGTFFTEALGSHTFGREGLSEACKAMVERGHDVQLHTHPIQRVADYRTRGQAPAKDDIGAYDVATQVEILQEGTRILEDCGVPKVRAFRAGNFGADNGTWEAMAKAGLVLSSNYNPCYFGKNCKMRLEGAGAGLFRAPNDVWELPISTFTEHGGGQRHVQITAISLAETIDYLEKARALGLHEVTVVTHSFELCHIDSISGRLGRPNTINLLRFRGLCRYLAAHSDAFEVDTVGALAERLANGTEAPKGPFLRTRPAGSLRKKLARLPEQALKRLESRAKWAPSFV